MFKRALCILTASATCLLTVAPLASAAQRWATSSGGTNGGACTSLAPCTLTSAVNSAGAADEVIVAPGTYTVSTALVLPAGATMRGQDGMPRPTLVGDASLAVSTLSIDAVTTVSHLRVEATKALSDAMTIKGGATVEDVILVSAAGDAAKVVGSPATTTLRDSVAVSRSSDATSAALKLRDGSQVGSLVVRNVTAWAASTTAILCDTNTDQSSIVNTIARGSTIDVDASVTGALCSASYSNLRPASSPGLGVSNIQSAAPILAAPASTDFRPLAGSPTIDAGTTSGQLGSVDPSGNPRATTGSAPDIGAYEYVGGVTPPADPAPAPTATTTGGTGTTGAEPRTAQDPVTPTDPAAPSNPAADDAPPPQLGRSVVLGADAGTVKVKLPGSSTFVALDDAANLPTGTVVDTRDGQATLRTALPGGRVQTGTFGGGLFEVRQSAGAGGMTDIHLRGGSFRACASAATAKRRAVVASAAAAGKRKRSSSRRPVRRLWASDKGGRFRTHGRDSVATVRGTRWLTEDRCDGTLTRVVEGAVDVRDVRRGTSTRVRAGRSVLVRHS